MSLTRLRFSPSDRA